MEFSPCFNYHKSILIYKHKNSRMGENEKKKKSDGRVGSDSPRRLRAYTSPWEKHLALAKGRLKSGQTAEFL